MRRLQIIRILIVLLTTFKLQLMEETIQNKLLWNTTYAISESSTPFHPHLIIYHVGNKNSTVVTHVTTKKSNNISHNKNKFNKNDRTKPFDSQINKIEGTQAYLNQPNVNINDIHITTMETPVLLKPTRITRRNRQQNRNFQNMNSRSNKTRTNSSSHGTERQLKNCENDCESTWYPVLENKQHVVADNNQNSVIKDDSLLSRLKNYMTYDQNAITPSNNYNMDYYKTYYNTNDCSNLTYTNQSCITNNKFDNSFNEYKGYESIDRAYQTNDNGIYRYYNTKGYVRSPYYSKYKKRYPYYYTKRPMYNSHKYNKYHKHVTRPYVIKPVTPHPISSNKEKYVGNTALSYPVKDNVWSSSDDNKDYNYNNYNPENTRIKYTDYGTYQHSDGVTVGYTDNKNEYAPVDLHHYSNHHKWKHHTHHQNTYDDRRALSKLKDMYYCNKYCHCCKKNRLFLKVKHQEHGVMGQILHRLKDFGFDSGYNLFYGGRAMNDRADNTIQPRGSHYTPYNDHHPQYYDTDESFVFFDEDKGQPDGVTECKEVCSCCEENKKEKYMEKLKKIKEEEEKKKKKFQGLAGILRYLIFSNDDGTVDLIDSDKKARSFDGYSVKNNYKKNELNKKVNKKYDDEYQMSQYQTGAGQGYYDPSEQKQESNYPAYEIPTFQTYYDPSEQNHESTYSVHETPTFQTYYDPGEQHVSTYPTYEAHTHVEQAHSVPEVHEVHDHSHEVKEHDDHKPFWFDCSKCCRFCKKKPQEDKRGKRRKKKKGPKGVLDYLKDLVSGDIDEGGEAGGGSDDGKNGPSFGSVSLTSGNDYLYDNNYFEPQFPSIPSPSSNSTTCCFNTSTITTLAIAITISLIIINTFSSVNVITIIIIPLIFFGFVIILILLAVQAIVPIYFIPIFIILLIIVIIPIILLVLLFFLLLPVFLIPIFIPFILRLPGNFAPTPIAFSAIDCLRHGNSTNCTIGSDIPLNATTINPLLLDAPTESINFVTDESAIESTTSLIDYEGAVNTVLPINDEDDEEDEQDQQTSKNFYWKINSILGSSRCLERVGCHLAIFTRSLVSYNKFILRILENISTSLNESKFTAYKDAYQIGSSNVTNHEKCTTLYYCKALEKYKNKIN